MNITVCIKRTPDTETRVRVAGDGVGIDPAGVKYIVSPYDEMAVEAALRTKEALGAGEVDVLSLGEDAAVETLRSGLAMGADKATLLKGAVTMDGLATAKALKAELEGRDDGLVLFGVKAADDDQQQVGPMVATLLGRPCVTAVADFQVQDGKAVCHREVEGGMEVVEVPLPAVLTITKGAFDPRYASLKGIMAAKRKPLEQKDAQVADSRLTVQALELPPERPAGRVVGEGPDAAAELVRLLREEAKVL
ncbi:MAG TPA: electron transfer flavoprotein subunit beta/FixA family protein [Longimicrobiales bacterium]|nr:electron transfer flavoprotein subunit beta/FixA family protein [Longimicrobiales bacterium]